MIKHLDMLTTGQVSQGSPRYTGRSYLESRINRDNALYQAMVTRVGAGTSMAIGSKRLAITQRQGNGSYRVYFGLEVPEEFCRGSNVNLEDLEATRQLLLSDFYADWGDEYKDLIQHSTDFRAWSLYSLSEKDMGWPSVSGLTLVGDAAHLAPPNGDGVNLAMLDALELAAKIAEHGIEDIDRAVQEYEAGMFPRGAETIIEGDAMAKIMFNEDAQPFIELMTSFGAGHGAE